MKITKDNIKTIIICFIGGLILPFISCRSCHESLSAYARVSFLTVSLWLLMWFGNEFISHSIDKKISWTTAPVKRFVVGIAGMIIYTVGTTFLLVRLVELIFGAGFGNISNVLYSTVIVTAVITLFMTSRSFLFCWKQTAIDAERLQRENLAARYENLKSQVNPHFLFNSLNALTNLVYEDQDKAVKFIKQLSDVYRYVLDTRDREVVPLEEELKFLESYVYLQQIRFGDKLKIDLHLNGTRSLVAPLSLQMLIENAIKHNVVSEKDPLHVKVYSDDQYLSVENNLQKKMVMSENSPGVGLENIRRRYEFLVNKEVLIEESATKFIVRLPVILQSSKE